MFANIKCIAGTSGWIEQDTSIAFKACDEFGDPLELTADEARAIARMMLDLADELDRLDGTGEAQEGKGSE